MPASHPILAEDALRNFSRLVEHVAAHERSIADLAYDPVAAPQLIEPLLVDQVFDPARFDDALFFDLFAGMSAEAERAIAGLFRVYIDGMLSPQHENEVLYARPEAGERFEQFLSRAVGDRPFGIVVNGAEQWSEPLARLAAKQFAPIIEAVGGDRSTLEVTLFIGNYGFTPFGIHIDDPYTSVVHFHVGPATKEMTLFGKEEFHRLNGERKNCFTPERLVSEGRTFVIQPGDVFLLPPHYYHIGNTPSFSIGVAVAFSKYPEATIAKQILGRAVAADALAAPIETLLARSEASGETFAGWLGRARDEFHAQGRSRGNLRYSHCRHVRGALEADALLAVEPAFAISRVDTADDLVLYVRGNRLRLAQTPVTSRLVSKIFEVAAGGALSVREVHRQLRGEVSLAAVHGVMQQLVRFGGLVPAPSVAVDASLFSASLSQQVTTSPAIAATA